MTELPVDDFVFEFPDGWTVIKYDECNFYRNRFGKPEDVKGVDVLAIGNGLLYLIEAKDLRRYRLENKERVTNGELTLEIAKKVRDTIAVLYGAYRHGNRTLGPFCAHLFAQGVQARIRVVFLLEEDRPPTSHKSFKRIRSDLRLAVKKKLKYLDVRCSLHDCGDLAPHCGWTVRM